MKLEMLQAAHHRNGVGGLGFWAVRFRYDPGPDGVEEFLATVFEEQGGCAVLSLSRMAEFGVKFGPNSWRGDRFEDVLRPFIDKLREDGLIDWEAPAS